MSRARIEELEDEVGQLRAEVARLRSLLEQLAPEDCPHDGEYGYCITCDGDIKWNNAAYVFDHRDDCAWVAARKELTT